MISANYQSIVQAALPQIQAALQSGNVNQAEALFSDLATHAGDANLQSLSQASGMALGPPPSTLGTSASTSANVTALKAQLAALQIAFPSLSARIGPMLSQLGTLSQSGATAGGLTADQQSALNTAQQGGASSSQLSVMKLQMQLGNMVANGASASDIASTRQQLTTAMFGAGATSEQVSMMNDQFQMQDLATNGGSMSDYQSVVTDFLGRANAAGLPGTQVAVLQAQLTTCGSPAQANAILANAIATGAFNAVGGLYQGSGSQLTTAALTNGAPQTAAATVSTTGTLTADQQTALSRAQQGGASSSDLTVMQLQMTLQNTMARGGSSSDIQNIRAQILNIMVATDAPSEQVSMLNDQFQMQDLEANGGSMSTYQSVCSDFLGRANAAGLPQSQVSNIQAQMWSATSPAQANQLLNQLIASGAFNVVGGPYQGSVAPPATAPAATYQPPATTYTPPAATYTTPPSTYTAPAVTTQYGGSNSVINQGIANGAFSTALTADQQNMLNEAQQAGASGPQLAMMQLQMQMENQQEVLQAISKIFNMLDQTAKATVQNF